MQIDWSGIRANAVTLGIRGSARAAAADLPNDERSRFVERVMKRASREGWEEKRKEVMVSAGMSATRPLAGAPAKELSANVRSASDAMSAALAGHRDRGTLAGARLAADTLDQASPVPILTASDLLAAVKAHRAAHGLDRDGQAAGVSVNILVQ